MRVKTPSAIGDKVIELYDRGRSLDAIAELTGLSRRTVARIVKRAVQAGQVRPRKPGFYKKKRRVNGQAADTEIVRVPTSPGAQLAVQDPDPMTAPAVQESPADVQAAGQDLWAASRRAMGIINRQLEALEACPDPTDPAVQAAMRTLTDALYKTTQVARLLAGGSTQNVAVRVLQTWRDAKEAEQAERFQALLETSEAMRLGKYEFVIGQMDPPDDDDAEGDA